jgi:hypothetical protein
LRAAVRQIGQAKAADRGERARVPHHDLASRGVEQVGLVVCDEQLVPEGYGGGAVVLEAEASLLDQAAVRVDCMARHHRGFTIRDEELAGVHPQVGPARELSRSIEIARRLERAQHVHVRRLALGR